jgi:CRP/FNR family transcriptional regulator
MSKTTHPDCVNCSLRSKSIFSELNTGEAHSLSFSKTCVVYKKGQSVFHEGSYPRGLYCVNSGKIKITQTGYDGKEHIIHLAKDADVMGYRAILSEDKYSCSAVALEESRLCFIPKDVFFSMVEKNSKVALQLIHLFSKELKEAEKKITRTQQPVKERIAQGLLLLKERYGFENDGSTIDVSVTREEIANISGTTRETAIRALFELKEDKIIGLYGKKIKVLQQTELIRAANIFD